MKVHALVGLPLKLVSFSIRYFQLVHIYTISINMVPMDDTIMMKEAPLRQSQINGRFTNNRFSYSHITAVIKVRAPWDLCLE